MGWFTRKQLNCTWLLYEFSVAGSYKRDFAEPADRVADTQQYWITPESACDVRTFALDRDIRVLRLDYVGRVSEPVPYFAGVAERAYGDIIRRHVTLAAAAEDTEDALIGRVRSAGLFPHVEITPQGFPLWLPENAKYSTQHAE